jgi:hypothetical protein
VTTNTILLIVLIGMTLANILGIGFFLYRYFMKMQKDWAVRFAETEMKFKGVLDTVTGVYAELSEVRREIALLQPGALEELEMRIENMEFGAGIQRSFVGGRPAKEYRPKKTEKIKVVTEGVATYGKPTTEN